MAAYVEQELIKMYGFRNFLTFFKRMSWLLVRLALMKQCQGATAIYLTNENYFGIVFF